MANISFIEAIISRLDVINDIITRYDGIFINYDSCASDGMIVVRVTPYFVGNILNEIQALGFIVRDYRISGIQTYIYFGGFMF